MQQLIRHTPESARAFSKLLIRKVAERKARETAETQAAGPVPLGVLAQQAVGNILDRAERRDTRPPSN